MRKVRQYKGFVIAVNTNNEYHVYPKSEWAYMEGFRYPEFVCDSIAEAMENIDSY